MHYTVMAMMGNGCVPKDLQYENDYSKKKDASMSEENQGGEVIQGLNDPMEIMYKLNEANWSYHIESFDGVYKYVIPDLDCLRISYRQKKLEEGIEINQAEPEHCGLVFLPLSGLTVNLDTNEAYYDSRRKRFYRLVRSPDNSRRRSKLSRKFIYQQFMFAAPSISPEELQYSQIGYRWSKEVRGDVNRLPTMNQVFNGLSSFLADFLRKKLAKSSKKWQDQCIGRYKATFHYILDLIGYQGRDRPITAEDLRNPNSKALCLILYIYSMDTPFTGQFNQSFVDNTKMTQNDYQFALRSLGPFDRCLQEILHNKAELNRFDRLES